MSLLRNEPPAPMRTLDEFFAVAHALEEEASARYALLANQMRVLDLPDVAAVFQHLAVEERGHADQVAGWAYSASGTAPNPAWIRWQPPETFDEEEARAMATSRLASAYRALSMAVRNEERAFALWTYIAAQAEESAVRSAAERMAGEELGHAMLLRRERRRAFHAERSRRDATKGPATQRPPAQEAVRIEHALAALLSVLAEGATAAEQASELHRLATEAHEMASAAASGGNGVIAQPREDVRQLADDAPNGLPKAMRLCERAVEVYLDAGDAAHDEAEMGSLQALAERSIARLVILRRMAGEG